MLKTAAAFSLTIDTHLEFQQGGRRKKHSSKIQKKTNIKQKVIQTQMTGHRPPFPRPGKVKPPPLEIIRNLIIPTVKKTTKIIALIKNINPLRQKRRIN
ncbi:MULTISPECIES: hypothetical protein [Serratia]|uniref:hypothetical protein n=1 Tax=Serratia TaxID=613 RepID=UPI0013D9D11B|nr:hypothetical protein [Serratia marcescens]MBH3045965.1 hypothetical protein [Serratia marcescens]MBH3145437.1 hypothetical protein [Serratia marcescens]MDT8208990.1 hypothetical protein [Serratia marcescens]HEI9728698.1 hypothetical protein [Serratia marcescens]HEI9758922.1 hypothetical protein [Serratia marcescens]